MYENSIEVDQLIVLFEVLESGVKIVVKIILKSGISLQNCDLLLFELLL